MGELHADAPHGRRVENQRRCDEGWEGVGVSAYDAATGWHQKVHRLVPGLLQGGHGQGHGRVRANVIWWPWAPHAQVVAAGGACARSALVLRAMSSIFDSAGPRGQR